MTVIQHKPLVIHDMVVKLGATDQFEKAISSAAFTPSASTITWQGGTPDASFTDVGPATWVCALTYAQDWDTANSLSRYLYDHEGDTVAASFSPRKGTGPSFTADLIITPGAIGGAVGAVSEATVSLGCQGKPKLVPAGGGA